MVNRMKMKGFTLIEIIVSIAIIGILLIGILTSFAGNYGQVLLNGSRTKSVFSAQNKIDDLINNINDSNGDPQVNVQAYDMQMKLYSSDGKECITSGIISGSIIKVEINDKSKVTLSTFVPDK